MHSNFPISFDGFLVSPVDNINILGLNINKKNVLETSSHRLLGWPQRNWEFCLDCETFFLLLSCSSYTRASSALVWSTVLISGGALVSPGFWTGSVSYTHLTLP